MLLSLDHRQKNWCLLLHQPLQLFDGYDLSLSGQPRSSFSRFSVLLSPLSTITKSALHSLIFNLFILFLSFFIFTLQFFFLSSIIFLIHPSTTKSSCSAYSILQSLHLFHLWCVDLLQNKLGNSVSHLDLEILVKMVEQNYTNFGSVISIDHTHRNISKTFEGKFWSCNNAGGDLQEMKLPV